MPTVEIHLTTVTADTVPNLFSRLEIECASLLTHIRRNTLSLTLWTVAFANGKIFLL